MANVLKKDPEFDALAAIHALWIGLYAKMEANNITTERANKIFEDFKWEILSSYWQKKNLIKNQSKIE